LYLSAIKNFKTKIINLNYSKMKQITKFFALATVMVAFATTTFGQNFATATASATIVAPIAISHVGDLNFGNITSGVGTVVLTTVPGRSTTGTVGLIPANPGTVTAAAFAVTGVANATYTITLPGIITVTDGSTTMNVDTWTTNYSPGIIGTIDGTQLLVGATLHVTAANLAGNYVSAPFTVTVNYN
jgi:hypothetical protein